MFCEVMSDPDICKEFLEQLLNVSIKRVTFLETQQEIRGTLQSRTVRLDVLLSDGKTLYNIEMQNRNQKDLPERSRFYHARIAGKYLQASEEYIKLPPAYVIFICDFDPFDAGYALYQVRKVLEPNVAEYRDGQHTIYLNNRYAVGNAAQAVLDLLDISHFGVTRSTPPSRLAGKLLSAIEDIKTDSERSARFMSTFDIILEQGREQGREEGREQGISLVDKALAMIAKGATLDAIKTALGIDLTKFPTLMALYQSAHSKKPGDGKGVQGMDLN